MLLSFLGKKAPYNERLVNLERSVFMGISNFSLDALTWLSLGQYSKTQFDIPVQTSLSILNT